MLKMKTDYDVKCMLCGTEVGQIVEARFKQHSGCSARMPRQGGLLRCCHCGGSLYLDPIDVYSPMVDRAQLARMFADSAA
jgi:transcription elongation factor Elf1